MRRGGRHVLERRSLPLRALPVHGLDPDQSPVALAPPRLPGGPAHLVARAKLTAADLGGGDVDVALALPQAAQPEESVARGHAVEDAGDRLGIGLGLRLAPLRLRLAPLRLRFAARGLRLADPLLGLL